MRISIEIPEGLWEFAQAMARDGLCASPEAYVIDLMREDRARIQETMRLVEANPSEPMSPELFQRIRSKAMDQAKNRQSGAAQRAG